MPAESTLRDMTPETARLVEAAHRCEGMAAIEEHLPYRSFGEMWERNVAERADRTWMTYYACAADDETPEVYSFGEFGELITRVAVLLARHYGIGPGGSIATLTINQPLTVAIYFAAWRLGARVVPINPGEADDRAAYIVNNSDATLLVAHHSCRESYAGIEAGITTHPKRAMVTDHACVPPAGWEDFLALLDGVPSGMELRAIVSGEGAGARGEITAKTAAALPHAQREEHVGLPRLEEASWDAECLVVYTSGTTGNPKGVVLTQKQMFADALAISRWHEIDEHTVMMNVLPIHHVNGIVVTLLTPAFAGAPVVVNKRFRSRGFWERLARHDVAIVSVVPTLLQFLIDADEELLLENIPNFRHFICGAGPLSVELARDFQDKFGLRIVHGYGLSETVCYSCFLPPALDWDEHCAWMYDHGFPSIGCPIVTNEMAIHDASGQPVAEGQRGEIVIRGHNVMSGYYRNPEANATTFAHGWFRSGDEGFLRRGEDGRDYFFITGRIKELIIRGGVNISPFEIDEVLCSMPGVRVGLAVGFDNRYYGEEVGAYVQVQAGQTISEAQVLAWCREKLPAAKCPKVVLFGDDIPVTSTGKYQRGRLKGLFEGYKDRQFK